MPIVTIKSKNLFDTDCNVLVNTVNCVGVMGAGIALEVKNRHPEVFNEYKRMCDEKIIKPGVLTIQSVHGFSYQFILNFPTKRHWRDDSLIEDIDLGVKNLYEYLLGTDCSIAIPKLGCGNGGLNWMTVKPIISRYLYDLPNLIKIYE